LDLTGPDAGTWKSAVPTNPVGIASKARQLNAVLLTDPAGYANLVTAVSDALVAMENPPHRAILSLRLSQLETLLSLGYVAWAKRTSQYVMSLAGRVDATDPLLTRLYVAYMRAQLAVGNSVAARDTVEPLFPTEECNLLRGMALIATGDRDAALQLLEPLKMSSTDSIATAAGRLSQ
jgi:hypothetical protein